MKEQLFLPPYPNADPIFAPWLAALEDGRIRTKEVVANLSTDVLDWQSPYIDNTIGTLLYHIALVEADWLYCEILDQAYPDDIVALFPIDMRDAAGRLSHVAGLSLAEHFDRLDYTRQKLLTVCLALAGTEFHRARQLPAYDVTPAWVLNHLLQHEADHRGQIRDTLRLAAMRNAS